MFMKLIILSLISLVNSVNAFNQIDVGLVSKLYRKDRNIGRDMKNSFDYNHDSGETGNASM